MRSFAFAAALGCFVAAPSVALTQLRFEGQVTTAFTSTDPYYAGVAVGDPMSITIRFDESVAPSSPGVYQSSGPGIGFTATIDGLTFSSVSLPVLVSVQDRGPGFFDTFTIAITGGSSVTTPPQASPGDLENAWSVDVSLPNTAFSSSSLTDALAVLPSVPSFSFRYVGTDDFVCDDLFCFPVYAATIQGNLTLVPEPSTALLVGLGLAGVALGSRRSARQRPD